MQRIVSTPSQRAVCVALALFGLQPRALAQGDELGSLPPDKVRLEYRTLPECPDASTFKALVGSRLPAEWEAGPGELARRVDVVVSGAAGGYVATIELVDERGVRVTRAVRGSVCSNVVDGIALVTALVIQSRVEEALDRTEPVSAPAPAEPVSVPAPVISESPNNDSEARRTGDALLDSRASIAVRMTARVAVTTGIAPTVAPGVVLGVVIEREATRLGIALQAYTSGRVETRGAPARFDLLAARVEGCPFTLAVGDWGTLEPCPFAEFGAVSGEAFEAPPGVVRGFRSTAPWVTVGPIGRMTARFGALAIELDALLGVPLRREEFYIEGGEVIFRVPALYGAVAAGLGVGF